MQFYEVLLVILAVFEIIKQSGANAQDGLSCAHIRNLLMISVLTVLLTSFCRPTASNL
jgi:hypothetical protein